MNKDELKGKAENLKGRFKDAAGSLTGDKGKQAEGLLERARGAIRERFGKAKREVSDRDVSRTDDDE
jgi:uncharacterized protein YjbJ (UPF0337 family)